MQFRYGSYATTPAQANYSAEDLEAVGLMYSLKSIEWLAQCRHVTVITDNTMPWHSTFGPEFLTKLLTLAAVAYGA